LARRRAEQKGERHDREPQRARRQMSGQLELPLEGGGEAPQGQRSGEAPTAANGHGRSGTDRLMEQVVERGNVTAALKRVQQHQGSPGVDGMTVEELPTYLAENWEAIRAQLLNGTYQPKPVRGKRRFRRAGAGSASLGFPPYSIGSSSRASCKSCSRCSTRPSRSTATASGRGATRSTRWARRSATSGTGSQWWWTWTSRRSSTASTTTC